MVWLLFYQFLIRIILLLKVKVSFLIARILPNWDLLLLIGPQFVGEGASIDSHDDHTVAIAHQSSICL